MLREGSSTGTRRQDAAASRPVKEHSPAARSKQADGFPGEAISLRFCATSPEASQSRRGRRRPRRRAAGGTSANSTSAPTRRPRPRPARGHRPRDRSQACRPLRPVHEGDCGGQIGIGSRRERSTGHPPWRRSWPAPSGAAILTARSHRRHGADDIVFARDYRLSYRSGRRESRHSSRWPWGRQHDHHCRRHGDPEGPGQADRIADPDGHGPAGQTDGRRSPTIKEFVPIRRARQPRLRRLGHLRGRLLRGREDRRACSRSALLDQIKDELSARQAHAGRVRSAVREAARRTERQEGQEQEGPGRAAHRRHPPVQGRQQARPRRCWSGAAARRSS